jgi:hypothetical protein
MRYEKHSAKRPHDHGGSIADLIHASAQHMTHHFGHPSPMALDIMNKGIREGIDTLHPNVRQHARQSLNGGQKLLARTSGGDFFSDFGNTVKGGFEDLGHQIVDTAKDVGHKIENTYNNDVAPALPGIVSEANKYYNNPATQGAMYMLPSSIPLSVANFAISNGLDMAANHRNPEQQFNYRYGDPAKKAVGETRKLLGVGVGKKLKKKLAENVGRLADSGSDYLIRQMDGHGVGDDLGQKLGDNLGRLADSGTNYLLRQMDGHGCGGEIGDGLYAQGRGVRHPKGSAEAKAHMAKIRAMRKGSKGGQIPQPPSRSPVTR